MGDVKKFFEWLPIYKEPVRFGFSWEGLCFLCAKAGEQYLWDTVKRFDDTSVFKVHGKFPNEELFCPFEPWVPKGHSLRGSLVVFPRGGKPRFEFGNKVFAYVQFFSPKIYGFSEALGGG